MVPCAVNRPHSDIQRTQQPDHAFLPQVVARLRVISLMNREVAALFW